jgi:hypothetical protein
VGFYLPVIMWFDFEEEIVVGGRPATSLWFYVVPTLQPSFDRGGCFTRIGLFTEFVCILHRFVRPWNRPGLLMILFESLVITIACCSVLLNRIQSLFLYLHYFLLFEFYCWGALPFCFGFIVGVPTLYLFLRSLTSSFIRIRSEKDPSL